MSLLAALPRRLLQDVCVGYHRGWLWSFYLEVALEEETKEILNDHNSKTSSDLIQVPAYSLSSSQYERQLPSVGSTLGR